jgi:AmmeMemoRadiSam system protein A
VLAESKSERATAPRTPLNRDTLPPRFWLDPAFSELYDDSEDPSLTGRITKMAEVQKCSLPESLQKQLVQIARYALQAAAERRSLAAVKIEGLPEALSEPRATFVTLTKGGSLRGCIGALEAKMPLIEDVQQHTVAAALHDFRFSAVTPDEVNQIRIEISILSPPQPLQYGFADELIKKIRPGIDGVLITDGKHRATFLPQVWERLPSPDLFLSMLCEKAALSPDAWRNSRLKVYTYQVESIHEEEVTPS